MTHSLQRFKERYGKDLTEQKYNLYTESIKILIKEKKTEDAINGFLVKFINTEVSVTSSKVVVAQHIILIEDDLDKILCVFETQRNTITTFLPYDPVKIKQKTKK